MSLNSIDFDSIVDNTLEIFQDYLDETNADLRIHRLTEMNFIKLRAEEHKINWSYIIKEKLTFDGGFDFGLTWQTAEQLSGALIAAYKLENQCLEIYGIEQFNFPVLDGQMMEHSLYASNILLILTQGKFLKLIDVDVDNHKLRAFYKSYGFKECGKSDFILTAEQLAETVVKFLDKKR